MPLTLKKLALSAKFAERVFAKDNSTDNKRNCVIKHAIFQHILKELGVEAEFWSGTAIYQSYKAFVMTKDSGFTKTLPKIAKELGLSSREEANEKGLAEVACLANKAERHGGENDLLGHVALMVKIDGWIYLVDLASNQFYRRGLIECDMPQIIDTRKRTFDDVMGNLMLSSSKGKYGCLYLYESLTNLAAMRTRFLMGDQGSNLNPKALPELYNKVKAAVEKAV